MGRELGPSALKDVPKMEDAEPHVILLSLEGYDKNQRIFKEL